MKRRIVFGMVLLSVALASGCGEKNDVDKSTSSPSATIDTSKETSTQEPERTSKPEITTKPKASATPLPQGDTKEEDTSVKYKANQIKIDGLNSKAAEWWFGTNVDDKNRPIHPLDAQKSQGKYGGDFIKGDEKKIYLTFDEGYENGYSNKILDTLKEKKCPAVFFVTMEFAKENGKLIERMINEGHVVGNHSVNHPSKGVASLSIESQKEEVMGLHRYIKEKYNYDMYLFRYPAGNYSEQSLAIINNLNYRSVFWSFAYYDYDPDKQPNQKEALTKLNQKLHPGAIYLLHAVSKTNTVILGEFIDNTRKSGYEFCSYTL